MTSQTSPSSPNPVTQHHSTKKIRVIKKLNQSKYPVLLAKAEDKEYAMKVYPYGINKNPVPAFNQESKFNFLKHQNVISIIESVPKKIDQHGKLFSYILMELAPYGDLANFIMNDNFIRDERLART